MHANIITPLSYLGLLRVGGQDAEKFLQGQLTCDVRLINPLHSSLGAYCNHKGRMLAIFRVFFYQEHYYLQMPANMVENVLLALKKYAVFSKVTLENVTQEFTQLGCGGPQSAGIIKSIGLNAPIQTDDAVVNKDCILLQVQGAGTGPRFECIGPSGAIRAVQAQLTPLCDAVTPDVWRLLDIQAGVPTLYPDTMELFTPQMVNLPQLNGVSFNKGCYVGQEVIARTHYLGKAKRELSQMHIATKEEPMPGSKLLIKDGAEAGIIVTAAPDETGFAVLAVLQQQAMTENCDIFFHGVRACSLSASFC